MEYTYVPPTLGRLSSIYRRFPGESMLRALEYEKLSTLAIAGHVLDVGGGEKAPYTKFLTAAEKVSSVNIDPGIKPTYLLQPDQPFPVEDAAFDNAICFNTLEHIYDAMFVIREIHRSLKPGGAVYITVPFMFRVHGHPDDFFRATTSWWRETMKRAGFAQMEIMPLTWGRATTGRSITGFRGPFARLRLKLTHLSDWLYAQVAFRGETYDGKRGERICGVTPGYFIKAVK